MNINLEKSNQDTQIADLHARLSAVVQFFDEWELALPLDAREVLRPIAEAARAVVPHSPHVLKGDV